MLTPLEKELLAALKTVMDYSGGWDSPADHPCGVGRDMIAKAQEIEKTPVRIGLTVEGGVVQAVFSDAPDRCPPVYVIDYDTDGADKGGLTHVPQLRDNGTVYGWERAFVADHTPESCDRAFFDHLDAALNARTAVA